MTEQRLETIPFKDRKHFVQEACFMYKKMTESKEKLLLLDSEHKLDLSQFDKTSLFEGIMELLNKDEALIIKKDFIDRTNESEWYLDHWCKTSYYKLKHDAINRFLYLLFS